MVLKMTEVQGAHDIDVQSYWKCNKCPLAEECNPENFKSWKPWGFTQHDCRTKVLHHLRGSGLHREAAQQDDREEEYMTMAECCELEEVFERTRVAKRKATSGNHGSDPMVPPPAPWSSRHPSGSGAGGAAIGARPPERLEPRAPDGAALQDLVRKAVVSAISEQPQPAAPTPTMNLSSSTTLSRRGSPTSSCVSVSLSELQEIGDSLTRASRSANHLQRLCTAAAAACGEEKLVIDEALEAIKVRISAAGLQWRPS